MDQLSSAKKLGVIVLAAKYLGNLNLPFARLISSAARALGVSRKTGYQTAQRIEEELRDRPGKEPGEEKFQREVFLLRIQNQILRYRLEHDEVRFAADGSHLPPDAKSLCVRILRDFKGKLSLSDIANAIGVATSSLGRWDTEADSECQFPEKPERRGTSRHATPEEAKQVVEAFENLEEDMTLEEFVNHYNSLYEDAPLDRRTITRILQAAGLYTPEPRSVRKEDYHGKFTVYFPGAQVAVDGKETTVHFTGESEESVTVVKEVAIDIASKAIVGDVLRHHEDAEGVERVVVKAREECESLLAVLADNRSSNTAAQAQAAMEEHSELGPIFTFPYHARTNGYLEGFFGLFSRIVGRIEIDDTSRVTLARSIVELVWRIVICLYNRSPQEDLGFKGPAEYLKTYTVLPREVEKARKGLADQQQRSRQSRGPHPRLSDSVFRALVARILTEHQFEGVELDHALESLVHYDQNVIESASCAFSAYSQRDGFQESKRTFAYFMGIVKNKQKAVDEDRRNAAADVLRAQRLLDEDAAHRHNLEEEQRQERNDLKTQPETVILTYAQILMKGRFRWLRERCLQPIREGLQALCRLGRTSGQVLECLAVAIRGLPDFAEDLKEQMVRLLSEEIEQLAGS
jgi:transposase